MSNFAKPLISHVFFCFEALGDIDQVIIMTEFSQALWGVKMKMGIMSELDYTIGLSGYITIYLLGRIKYPKKLSHTSGNCTLIKCLRKLLH